MRFIMWGKHDGIQLTAHRGIKGLIPENTIPSFRAALDLGVDVLEYDVHMSRDRELAIMHDSTVDRTTDGSGAINFMTLMEIKQLDAGIKFSEEYRGLRVPTLRETLELFSSYDYSPCQIVEIKDFRPEVVDAVVAMLEEYGLIERTVIEAGDAPTILYLQDNYPAIRTLVFPPMSMKRLYPEVYERVWGVAVSIVSRAFKSGEQIRALCDEFAAAGKELFLFCGDNAEQIEQCIEYGAANITTNFAPFAIEYRAGRGLRARG
jgi:glycerophosphoryl diester phosphodiesterase